MTKDFLLEIGCEELPAVHLTRIANELRAHCLNDLLEANLINPKIHTKNTKEPFFATPRRLAVLIKDINEQQADQTLERFGPALAAAFDATGQPTKAALGFAKSCGTEIEHLEKKDGKLFFLQKQKGKSAQEILPTLINKVISQLPITKPMRWGNSNIEFLRPVHWVVMLLGDEIIKTKILGVDTDRFSFGHRFHAPNKIEIKNAKQYVSKINAKKFVLADFDQRQTEIQNQITELAQSLGGHILADKDLLQEVTGLVEWPVALVAQFDKKFLSVPAEALTSAMKQHQKCFPVYDQNNKLMPYFIFISNIPSKDPRVVIHGNERVMRARLEDAAFFYHEDLKTKLRDRVAQLQKVIFQLELGTLFEKTQRMAKLANYMSSLLKVDAHSAELAAGLAKADLTSSMVGEFPELQGVMGYYYAMHDGEDKNLALAIKEHYAPRFWGDELPTTTLGCIVAIVDKLDSLVGIFGINKIPTGEKDPFALRRAAIGILRILIEKEYAVDLAELIQQAKNNYTGNLPNTQIETQLMNFFFERLRAFYEEYGMSGDIFNAVVTKNPTAPLDFHKRMQAVHEFKHLSEASALAAANKRVNNILAKEKVEQLNKTIDVTLLDSTTEHALVNALTAKETVVSALYQQKKYTELLKSLAELREPIDTFFDKVMVMVEDQAVRNNRLAILFKLREMFSLVADLSVLQ